LRRTVPQTRRRLLAPAALIAALAALLLLAPAALADIATPESGGSPNADDIDTLFKITLVIAIVIFLGVTGTLVYSLVRFRARKGRVAAQIHGNTNLEIGWTVGAALILVILAVVTFAMLPGIKDPARSGPGGLALASGAQFAATDIPKPPGGKGLRVEVQGRQFIWRYTYPNGAYSYEEMVVPQDTTVVLDITSTDVAHSWWIPKFGGKFDAIPGSHNYTWFKASEVGTYKGQCAELCGRGHADMFARVKVVPVPEYQAWVERQKKLEAQANKLEASEAKQQQGGAGAGAGG
jgi:cytochrome c oxidase subunit 2